MASGDRQTARALITSETKKPSSSSSKGRSSPTTWSTRPSGSERCNRSTARFRFPLSGDLSSIIDRVMASAPWGTWGSSARGGGAAGAGAGLRGTLAAHRVSSWTSIRASFTVTVPKSMRRAMPGMSLTGATTVANRSLICTQLFRAISGASSLILLDMASATSRGDGSSPEGSPVTRIAAVRSPYS